MLAFFFLEMREERHITFIVEINLLFENDCTTVKESRYAKRKGCILGFTNKVDNSPAGPFYFERLYKGNCLIVYN